MKITNQRPVDLNPIYMDNISKDFDLIETTKNVIVRPLFQPIAPNAKVTMQANGNAITEDDIVNMFFDCCHEAYLAPQQTAFREILGNCLVSFNKQSNLSMKELFAIQAGAKAGLDEPDANTIYTPATDIIPTSRKFLAGQVTYDELFATYAFYTRAETVGFYFACEQSFEDFKTWFATQHAMIASALTSDVNQLAAEVGGLTLSELTESLRLRTDGTQDNHIGSFPRLLLSMLMNYTKVAGAGEYGIMPFDAGELFCPTSVVFINIERHAKATAKEIADEWNLFKQAGAQKINMVSQKKLTKMTASYRNMQKVKGQAVLASQRSAEDAIRSANIKFRKTPPTSADMVRYVKRIMDKMGAVMRSENAYKEFKMTYQRPNRRDPDDFSKQGKTVSTRYKPDIHIYLDTSGSISERNYQDAVKACIRMAKKLNVNLYFNSFSHCMSQTTKLRTKDKGLAEVYREFQKVPKVSGGTDYAQIWAFINKSPKRKREISLLITDFEYIAPNRNFEHPKNIYYAPCSHMDYDDIKYWAEKFCRSLLHADPSARKHFLL